MRFERIGRNNSKNGLLSIIGMDSLRVGSGSRKRVVG